MRCVVCPETATEAVDWPPTSMRPILRRKALGAALPANWDGRTYRAPVCERHTRPWAWPWAAQAPLWDAMVSLNAWRAAMAVLDDVVSV